MGKGASNVCFSLKKGKKKRHPLFLFMTLLVFSFFKKSESEVTQSCPTLCDPMDCSLPCSSIWDFPSKSTGVGCSKRKSKLCITVSTVVEIACFNLSGISNSYSFHSAVKRIAFLSECLCFKLGDDVERPAPIQIS